MFHFYICTTQEDFARYASYSKINKENVEVKTYKHLNEYRMSHQKLTNTIIEINCLHLTAEVS
jgi:hypothetical protein